MIALGHLPKAVTKEFSPAGKQFLRNFRWVEPLGRQSERHPAIHMTPDVPPMGRDDLVDFHRLIADRARTPTVLSDCRAVKFSFPHQHSLRKPPYADLRAIQSAGKFLAIPTLPDAEALAERTVVVHGQQDGLTGLQGIQKSEIVPWFEYWCD
jgi:hypothetical protein